MMEYSVKMVLIGNGGTGKTTFMSKHKSGEFEPDYIATVGAVVETLRFNTANESILFTVWDTAGQEKLSGLREGYYIGANCALIMFDLTSRVTYKDVPKWYNDLKKVSDDAIVTIVGTKADSPDRKLDVSAVTFPRRMGLSYCEISSRSNYNIEKPFLISARKLLENPRLEFTAVPAQMPPDVIMTDAQKEELARRSEAATMSALPDDDDL